MGVFNNLKNIKKNYKIVKNSPYASAKFKYQMNKWTIIFVTLLVVWRIVDTAINFSSNGFMGLLGKILIILVGVVIVFKMKENLAGMKKVLLPYEQDEKKKDYYNTDRDVKVDIDDILGSFDKDGKRIEKEEKENGNINKEKESS